MPELRAIFFDIDDTLYSTTEFTKKARLKAIDEMDLTNEQRTAILSGNAERLILRRTGFQPVSQNE